MISRRGFLRFLGGGVAAAVAAPYVPKKAYSFLGGIFRPKPEPLVYLSVADCVRQLNGLQRPTWYFNRTAYIKISELLNEKNEVLDDVPWLDALQPEPPGWSRELIRS